MMQEISYTNQFNDTLFGHSWEIENPEKVVLIVTGMAEHSGRYDAFATFLNEHKMAVFCLDHYGQGKNGTLGNPGKDFFFKFQDTMVEYIKVLRNRFNVPVYIFSHSMGSFITQGYIEKHSDTVDKVIICGTNGRNGAVGLGKVLSKMIANKKNYDKPAKLLHNLAIGAYSKAVPDEKTPNAWLSYNRENVEKYDADPLSGYRCTNGFYKEFMNGLASIQKTKNIKAIDEKLPIFFIAGDGDPVGNMGKGVRQIHGLYVKYGKNAKIKIYEHRRHEILNDDNKEEVYQDILDFYNN